MAVTLGKRSRDELDITDCPARSTRAKRRAIATDNASTVLPAKVVKTTSLNVSKKAISPKITSKLKNSKPIEIYQDEKDIDAIPTPHETPRHRDIERFVTPTSKISVTPKHRMIIAKDLTSRTPRTPERSCTVIYNQARQLFARSSDPGALVGRASERAELTRFLKRHVDGGTCGSLYISGPPGTGKSALVAEVLEDSWEIRTTTINCMSIRSSSELTQKLVAELGFEDNALQAQFNAIPALVILDEVDRLVDLDLQLLYNLFEWTLAPSSKLVLIGIANALDMTDRCLPQLRSRGLKPDLLPVLPYSAAQIAQIITSKLKILDSSALPPFLHPTAIQFCAKKIAAQTGDLRKAFDICQRAIDLVEQETIAKDARESPKTPLMENMNLTSPVTRSYTVANVPRATIAHMAKITSQVFSNGANQRLATLNLQQKAVLCSLAALERRKRALQMDRVMFSTPSKSDRSAPTTKQLFESYSGLCKRSDMLHPLSLVEFREVVSGLETNGFVTGADGKHGSFVAAAPSSRKAKTGFVDFIASGDDRRMSSVLGERELRAVLNTAGGELLREIIDGEC